MNLGGVPVFDASRIAPRLWQGADPPQGTFLRRMNVDVLILCAEERQHDPSLFPGLIIVKAPMDDGEVVPVDTAMKAAKAAASLHRAGNRILVCCHAGLNRSGLVTALTLHRLTGASGKRCVEKVQAARPWALCNEVFRQYLERLPAGRRRSQG